MAKGYYLLVGDKTTCGGVIITGDQTITFNGRATAREGDHVTCGKHSGTYMIAGGVPSMFSMGRRLAGTLDSVSTCPCRAEGSPQIGANKPAPYFGRLLLSG